MSRVLVTGASSMIGRSVVDNLKKRGLDIVYPTHELFNLEAETHRIKASYIKEAYPVDYVIHLAGFNGGIQFNKQYPVDIYSKNTKMMLNLFDWFNDCKGIFSIIASCAYPDNGHDLLKEDEFWNGLPNKTVDCHGLAKRNLHAMSMQINKEAGYNKAVCGVLTNCYGPEDSYREEKTKVVGGMVKRFVDAKLNNVDKITCWGTGSPRRELMFRDDAGWLIANLFDKEFKHDLINIGTGSDISIKSLADTVKQKSGYKGEVEWDTTKPDGQMKKLLDNSRMLSYLPEYKPTELHEGIEKTVNWYLENKDTWTK